MCTSYILSCSHLPGDDVKDGRPEPENMVVELDDEHGSVSLNMSSNATKDRPANCEVVCSTNQEECFDTFRQTQPGYG